MKIKSSEYLRACKYIENIEKKEIGYTNTI